MKGILKRQSFVKIGRPKNNKSFMKNFILLEKVSFS